MNKATYLFTLVLTFHCVASMSKNIGSVVRIIVIKYFNNNQKSGRRINSDVYGSFYSDEDFQPANEFNINNEETTRGHYSDSLPYQHDLVSRPQPRVLHKTNIENIKTQIRDPYYHSTVNIYESSLRQRKGKTSGPRHLLEKNNLNGVYSRNKASLNYPVPNRNVKREFSERASEEDYYDRSLTGNEGSSPQPTRSNLKSISSVSDKTLLQENQLKENKDYLFENDDLNEHLSDYFSDKDDLNYPGRNIATKGLSSKRDTLQNDLDDYLNENYPGDKTTNQAFTLAKPILNNLHTRDGLRDAGTLPVTYSTQNVWFEYNEPANPVLPPEAKLCNPHSNCKFPFEEADIVPDYAYT